MDSIFCFNQSLEVRCQVAMVESDAILGHVDFICECWRASFEVCVIGFYRAAVASSLQSRQFWAVLTVAVVESVIMELVCWESSSVVWQDDCTHIILASALSLTKHRMTCLLASSKWVS